jgi:hypothetical protein
MSQSLVQGSDATAPSAKEDARELVRQAGRTLLALAVQRAVSRAEKVIDYIEAHAADPQEADSRGESGREVAPGPEADSPVREVAEVGRSLLAAASEAAERVAGEDSAAPADDHDHHEDLADGAGHGVRGVLSDLAKAGLLMAADVVDRLIERLADIAAGRGPLPAAGFRAAVAALVGKNPIWEAIKGGFSALSPGAKVLVIIALVLAAILLPVTVLLLLIALIVVLIYLWVKSRPLRS